MQTRLHLPIIIALYALIATGAFAQEVEPCACNDIGQIWLRALEVDAAVKSLDSSLRSKTDSTWATVQKKFGDAMKEVLAEHAAAIFEKPGEQVHTLYDAARGCHTEPYEITTELVNGIAKELVPTRCQLKWLDVHEAVHRASCTREGISWFFTDSSKILDDIQAYSAERDWLIAQENRLLQTCDYYSVRLQMEMQLPKPMGPRVLYGMDQPEVPQVDVPMHVSCGGGMKGDGKGVAKANWESQAGLDHDSDHNYTQLEFQISAEIGAASPELIHTTIQISPRDSDFESTTKGGGETVHVGSKTVGAETTATTNMKRVPGRPGTMVRHSAAPNQQASAVVDFSQLDQPVVCPVSPDGGTITCHATLMVAERYRDARAANNKGFTVRQALDAIAAADHTVVASGSSCHQTK